VCVVVVFHVVFHVVFYVVRVGILGVIICVDIYMMTLYCSIDVCVRCLCAIYITMDICNIALKKFNALVKR